MSVKELELFTGRRLDGESGLYDYRARMYSPALGRFMQPDLIGYADAMNLYQYCGNNPVNWIDPWGWAKVVITIKRDNRGGDKATTGSYTVTRDGKRVASGNTIEPPKGKGKGPIPAGNYNARRGTFDHNGNKKKNRILMLK